MEIITQRLFSEQDVKYRDFNARLIPNIEKATIIGVRSPQMRKIAAEVKNEAYSADFLAELPHKYHEENMLHAMLISRIKDYNAVIDALDLFLPYVDNWAVCDTISPKPFKKHPPQLANEAGKWLRSSHPYTVRFGIGVLMSFYLDDEFSPKYADMVASVRSEEYYVNMMIAWYFATALAKQYDCAVKYIENRSLDKWTHNKTIQKAIESRRVTEEHKAYLRSHKR